MIVYNANTTEVQMLDLSEIESILVSFPFMIFVLFAVLIGVAAKLTLV